METTWDKPDSLPSELPIPSLGRAFKAGLVQGCLLALAMLVIILSASRTRAQDNYEIQVYGYDLVEPRHTMVELHSNLTMDGSKTMIGGLYPTNHAQHETVLAQREMEKQRSPLV
jgi:hypothetical protein